MSQVIFSMRWTTIIQCLYENPFFIAKRMMALIAMAALLTGCSPHANPLLTASPNQAANFIYQASLYAEQTTQVIDSGGSVYVACMENPNQFVNPYDASSKDACAQVFHAMLDYAKQTKALSSLTLADLASPTVVQQLRTQIFAEVSTNGNAQDVLSVEQQLSTANTVSPIHQSAN